jgi:hypothetical protein
MAGVHFSPICFKYQQPDFNQRQRLMMMPASPMMNFIISQTYCIITGPPMMRQLRAGIDPYLQRQLLPQAIASLGFGHPRLVQAHLIPEPGQLLA